MAAKLKILVPVDFSDCARRAFAQALAWAARAPCEIHLAHVVNGAVADLASVEGAMLAHGLQELGHATGPYERHVVVGNPATEIVSVARRTGVDLIVMGTHGRRGLKTLLLGSVAESVVRHAPCPVVCVRAGVSAPTALDSRILCAVDFSEVSHRAMLSGAQLARHLGAELVLLHVRPLIEWQGGEVEVRLDSWRREAEAGGARVTTACVSGLAAAQIVGYARAHACELIVLGTHGRTGLAHVLMGSVAEGVVRDGPCAVLTVHPVLPLATHEQPAA